MPGMSFRVKLYGHMGRDDQAFAKKLSVVLAVDESAAQLLLQSVPMVVKEGLGEAQANSLCQLLTAIGALCLAEPMAHHAATSPPPTNQIAWSQREKESDGPKTTERRFSIPWATVLACALGLGLVLVVLSVRSSYTHLSDTFRPTSRVSEPEKGKKTAELPRAHTAMALQKLYAEIQTVERNLAHLRFIAELRERELHAVAGAYRTDRNVVRQRRILWERARADFDGEMKKLRELRAEITKIEREQSP